MKTRLFLFLLITTMSISCNSDKDKDKPSIVGNWTLYKRVYSGRLDEFCDKEGSCTRYEFNSNGTCTFYEDIYVDTYVYRIEGDFIKFYDPKTELLEDTDRIISLTKDELRLGCVESSSCVGCCDDYGNWVYKRDK